MPLSGTAIGVQEQQQAAPGGGSQNAMPQQQLSPDGESQNAMPRQPRPPAQPVTPKKQIMPDNVAPQ